MLKGFLGVDQDDEAAYEWGALFASAWPVIVKAMEERAAAFGAEQEARDGILTWRSEGEVRARFVFVNDPSDITVLRAIYNDEANVTSPVCYLIVRQHDPTDDRGDVIFDIFRMSQQSYLWHFHRVFTRQTGQRRQ